MTTNNKKLYRFIMTKTYTVDCEEMFENEEQASNWLNQKLSDGEFEDLAEDGYGIDEDFEIIELED